MQITIDPEFKKLIPPLMPEERKQLETNILKNGCLEPLYIWNTGGKSLLIDGNNRYEICTQLNKPFKVIEVALMDRDHVKLWIAEHQLGRRNLVDDQRAIITNDIREWRSKIARSQQTVKARAAVDKRNPVSLEKKSDVSVESTDTSGLTKTDSRKALALESRLPESKIRSAQEIKKADPKLSELVRTREITLNDAKKISVLPKSGCQTAVKAVEVAIKKHEPIDIRQIIRDVKKEEYNAKVIASKPRKLEGQYRILYADPPWKYIGLNQADEHGHAEAHYECLDDTQLEDFKVGKLRPVREVMEDNSVLFLWVTSPLLARCFPIIEAWGFSYKSSFIWDKVKHNMGHYNSVRHELLLIATRGSCTPDVSKLVDSVQSIERSAKHSEKPEEFRKIIEQLYDHGRKLELFRRGAPAEGWDADGDETAEAKAA